jgi:DNA repair protein RecO (recombination protein O)
MSGEKRVLRTQAIILRRSDLGEADRLLTLFTPEYGKVRAVAKGVRRPTAKAAGHVELYSLVDMVLARGRDLFIVSQVELVEPYLLLHEHLHRIGYASLFAELVDRFAVDEQENQRAFDLLVTGLGWLCEEKVDLKLASRYFELRLLETMGYGLSLFKCAVGGEPLEPEDQHFSVASGGVVCSGHVAPYERYIPLPLPTFKALRHFTRASWKQICQLALNQEQHRTLETILHSTLIYLLEQRLQSADFLRKLPESNR